jgi:hypothetical protein
MLPHNQAGIAAEARASHRLSALTSCVDTMTLPATNGRARTFF